MTRIDTDRKHPADCWLLVSAVLPCQTVKVHNTPHTHIEAQERIVWCDVLPLTSRQFPIFLPSPRSRVWRFHCEKGLHHPSPVRVSTTTTSKDHYCFSVGTHSINLRFYLRAADRDVVSGGRSFIVVRVEACGVNASPRRFAFARAGTHAGSVGRRRHEEKPRQQINPLSVFSRYALPVMRSCARETERERVVLENTHT